ncbi:MAG TPA: GNAT family N-acetyltransferase [Lysobacter sp.]|nr:GNAT family N-acetyltransferase [Lysobacter sp.]
MSAAGVQVRIVEYGEAATALHAVRDAVFLHEQRVPAELERDGLDPLCRHALACDGDGRPVGSARLAPPRADNGAPAAKLGRMAVLAALRGRGIGDALLRALLDEARRLGWRRLRLHAQAPAVGFYARHGFLPSGTRFLEAGIEHQAMQLTLDAPNPVETREAALAAWLAVIAGARRELLVYSRELDPGQLDQPEVLRALRRFATGGGRARIAVQDPAAPQAALAPLIGLAQRLPSAFEFHAVEDPTDRAYPSAFAANDRGGWLFRPLGHRFEGETRLGDTVRVRQLRQTFDPVWERARPCTEFRALGL